MSTSSQSENTGNNEENTRLNPGDSEAIQNQAPITGETVNLLSSEDQDFVITTEQLLANATDANNDNLSVINLSVSSGVLLANNNGTWTLTPVANFSGQVQLSYDISDGQASVSTTANINVVATNDAPVVTSVVNLSGTEDQALTITTAQLLANATDIDSNNLSVVNLSAGSNVTLVDNNNGTWTLTPAANFNGRVQLHYNVSDGQTNVPAVANINITPVDDFTSTIATTGELTLGNVTTGDIESIHDTDWFRIHLDANTNYQINLEGQPTDSGTLSDTYFRGIYNASGDRIDNTTNDDGGQSLNSQLIFSAVESGTYYLSAGAYSSRMGTYSLSVNEATTVSDDFVSTIDTTGELTLNSVATGSIDSAGDTDWFRIYLSANATYQINLEGLPTYAGTLSDTYFRGIYDANGNMISGTDDDDNGFSFNSQLVFNTTESGAYYLSAGAFQSNIGTYSLRITKDDFASTTDTIGRITLGNVARGDIEIAHDTDWFRIVLDANTDYQIDLEGTPTGSGTLSDTYFRGIYDASGNKINNTINDDTAHSVNSQLIFNTAESGTYYLSAGAFDRNIGTYALSINKVVSIPIADDFASTIDTTGEIEIGHTVKGRIELAGDTDWFRVDLTANTKYQINLEGAPTYSGTLGDAYFRGIYDSNGDPLGDFYDADGNLVSGTDNDDGGYLKNSQFDYAPTVSGTYYLSAGGFQSNVGTYSISIHEVTLVVDENDDFTSTINTTGELALGDVVTGNIELENDTDWFRVNLDAYTDYQINLEGLPTDAGTLSDPYFRGIYDAGGNKIRNTTNDDSDEQTTANSQLNFSTIESAVYYLSAGAFSDNTGTYSLSISEIVI